MSILLLDTFDTVQNDGVFIRLFLNEITNLIGILNTLNSISEERAVI
jgi:hypothetical protein